jgi:hypothetical protein
MPNLATDVHALVTQLKAVVAKLNDSENLTVVVDRFTITLKLTMSEMDGAGFKTSLVLIGASQTDALVQTLNLIFTERAPDETIQKFAAVPLEEPLLRASEAIDIAVGEAARGLDDFGFDRGSVTLAFTATEDGNLQFGIIKGGIKRENVSTVELEFRLKRDTQR